MQLVILFKQRIQATLDPATLMTLDLINVTDVIRLNYGLVAVFQILAKFVRFDRNRDHSVLHIIFPEWCTFWHFFEWLHGFLSGQDLVKLYGFYPRLGHKATVPMVLRNVLDLQTTALSGRLLNLLI